MEQFLRNYYVNLNPNATEEEILAFLASQGFSDMGDFSGMGNQTVTGGIMNAPNIIQDSGSRGIDNIIKGAGSGSINDFLDFIKGGGLIGSAVRGVENLFQNFADKRAGRLDVTADQGIMAGREQGSAEGSDAGFENTQSNESFNADANLGTSDFGFI
tara:strand:+ start:52 stop:525 length:474 start_codon:yes stop_codon:yes gene_type:complete